jgi:uncharacterized membrane protein YhaH (DUF805 family)
MNYFITVLKKYVDFTGRARRAEYWYFTLFSSIASIILMVIGYAINVPFLTNIYSLAVFIPTIAVGVRRMHDVNRSGWYLLIPIYSFVLTCTEGSDGPNNYGVDPKDPEELFSEPPYSY